MTEFYNYVTKDNDRWEEATNPNKTKHFPDCLRLQIYKTILLIIFKKIFFCWVLCRLSERLRCKLTVGFRKSNTCF